MLSRTAVLLVCFKIGTSSAALAEPAKPAVIGIQANGEGDAMRAQPRAGVLAGLAFAWKLVPTEYKDKLMKWASGCSPTDAETREDQSQRDGR